MYQYRRYHTYGLAALRACVNVLLSKPDSRKILWFRVVTVYLTLDRLLLMVEYAGGGRGSGNRRIDTAAYTDTLLFYISVPGSKCTSCDQDGKTLDPKVRTSHRNLPVPRLQVVYMC